MLDFVVVIKRKIIFTFGEEDHVYVAFVSGILRDFSAENLQHF